MREYGMNEVRSIVERRGFKNWSFQVSKPYPSIPSTVQSLLKCSNFNPWRFAKSLVYEAMSENLIALACPYGLQFMKPSIPKQWSRAIFSFQSIIIYCWYSMEKLACDVLYGSEFVAWTIYSRNSVHTVSFTGWDNWIQDIWELKVNSNVRDKRLPKEVKCVEMIERFREMPGELADCSIQLNAEGEYHS